MKIEKLFVTISVGLLSVLSAGAQASFQNLDFEQANPIFVGNPLLGIVTVASALPYWTVTEEGVQATEIFFNDMSLGAPSVDLVGSGDVYGPPPIDGNYSVLLQGSFPGSAEISQTGTIPSGTESLFFEAQPGEGTLDVLIGTQVVLFSAVGTGPNYTLYGANISAWAGDTEQLTFSAAQDDSGLNNWEIDDISFSQVPEPSIVALTAIGGLLFGARKWFARP
jgi:hypothetical protein